MESWGTKLVGVIGWARRRLPRWQRSPRRGRWMLVAVMVWGAVAAAALFPAAAPAQETQGFNVVNWSSQPIRLDHLDGMDAQATPPAGSVLYPGAGIHHFELIYRFNYVQRAHAGYTILEPGGVTGIFDAYMNIDENNKVSSNCSTDYGVCAPTAITNDNKNIFLYDPPGTVYDYPASGAGNFEAQAQALKGLCDRGNWATCQFTAGSEAQLDSPAHPVGDALINDTDDVLKRTVTIADTVVSSDSVEVGVQAGGKIAGLLNAEVSAKYGHEWTQEHTFGQADAPLQVDCPAHHKCWIEAVAPMYRDTGNFTITLGNTTWNLTGVYFDSPDPTRAESVSVEECKIGDPGCTMQGNRLSSWASTAPGRASSAQRPRKVLSGTYRVPHKVAVRGIVKPKLRHTIRGPSSVRAGGRASYRIALSRRQPHDRLSYAVKRVRVRGAVAGRLARRWTFPGLRAFQTRRMKMSVAVPGAARRLHCVRVRAVAKRTRAAKARHCAPVVRGSRLVGLG
jgi:hypothetical protein